MKKIPNGKKGLDYKTGQRFLKGYTKLLPPLIKSSKFDEILLNDQRMKFQEIFEQ